MAAGLPVCSGSECKESRQEVQREDLEHVGGLRGLLPRSRSLLGGRPDRADDRRVHGSVQRERRELSAIPMGYLEGISEVRREHQALEVSVQGYGTRARSALVETRRGQAGLPESRQADSEGEAHGGCWASRGAQALSGSSDDRGGCEDGVGRRKDAPDSACEAEPRPKAASTSVPEDRPGRVHSVHRLAGRVEGSSDCGELVSADTRRGRPEDRRGSQEPCAEANIRHGLGPGGSADPADSGAFHPQMAMSSDGPTRCRTMSK